MGWEWYDTVGKPYGLTRAQVAYIVKKYHLRSKNVLGYKACSGKSFREVMEREGRQVLPNWKIIGEGK